MAQLVEHHLAKVRVAGSNPVVRSERVSPSPYGEKCSPGGVAERRGNGLQIRVHGFKSRLHLGRLAQWERASLTRKRSLVQIQYRPPASHLVRARSLAPRTVPGADPETVAYLTAYLSPWLLMREEGVHRARTAGEHRPQLLAVHQLGDAAAGVANQVGDVLDAHSGAREQRH